MPILKRKENKINNPNAREKFQASTKTIGGYPAIAQGSKSTVVLVADRFQVKVRSKDDSFNEENRRDWLSKFDLKGLSQL